MLCPTSKGDDGVLTGTGWHSVSHRCAESCRTFLQGRASGAVGVPVPEPALGDCFVWGSNRARTGNSQLEPARCLPYRVDDTTHLDVVEASPYLSEVASCHDS